MNVGYTMHSFPVGRGCRMDAGVMRALAACQRAPGWQVQRVCHLPLQDRTKVIARYRWP